MTTKEAARRVGLAPQTLLARAKQQGVDLPVIETGRPGRPGYRWTVKLARAVAKFGRG